MTATTIVTRADRYGPIARGLHWLVAALAVIVVALGWGYGAAPHHSAARDSLLLLHRSVGLAILALVAFRGLWRWRHPPPPLPPRIGRLETGLAHLTHLGLYLIFLVMPLAGYVNAAAAGHAVSFFGVVSIPPLLPVDRRLAQLAIKVHLLGQYVIYLLLLLHVLGAVYHGVFTRDGVIDRMLPRRRSG